MPEARNHEIADALFANPIFERGVMYVEDTDSLRYLLPNGTWQDIDEKNLRHLVLDAIIQHSSKNPSPSLITDIGTIAKMRCEHRMPTSSAWYIRFKNGSLNLKNWQMEPSDPFERPAVIYIEEESGKALDPNAKLPPLLGKFLDTSLVKKDSTNEPDEGLQAVMQEMFGLCLYPGNPAENAFFMHGEGSNGKSVACDLLMFMLGGRSRVSTLNLEQLTAERFFLAEIASKLANICREEQSRFISAGAFRTIVSCEPVMAQRKFGHPFQFQPTLKLIFAVNRLPTMESGIDHSIRRRIVLLPFFRKFGNSEKTEALAQKIWEEDPNGVLSWAIRGLKNLKERNWNIATSRILSNEHMNQEYMKGVSNVAEYLLDFYTTSTTKFMPVSMIYQNYKDWCSTNGYKSKSKRNFCTDMDIVMPDAATVVKRYNGDTARCRMVELKVEHVPEDPIADPFDILLKEEGVDKQLQSSESAIKTSV